jgi:hypothetical protein
LKKPGFSTIHIATVYLQKKQASAQVLNLTNPPRQTCSGAGLILKGKEEGRRKKEEGRRKKEEGRRGNACTIIVSAIEHVLTALEGCYIRTSYINSGCAGTI